jgi:hypothetical protein
MLDNPKKARGLGFLVGVCVFTVATGLEVPAASAQDSTRVMASVQPQQPAARATNTTRQATAPKAAPKSAKRYFIDLRSRSALSYGHTFSVYGRLDAKGKIVESTVAGLHPFTESSIPWMIGHLLPVPAEHGASDGDTEDEYITASYRILLSDAEYNKVVNYIKEKQARSPVWHALLYNCNQYVADIAEFMGLKTPFSSVMAYPADFINGIKELNGGRQHLDASFLNGYAGARPGAQPTVTIGPLQQSTY